MNWLRAAGLRLLLALGLAFSLWVYVSFRENPDETASYSGVPVEVENLATGLVTVDRNGLPVATQPTVNITGQGQQTIIQTLKLSDVRAFADLSGLGPGEHQVPVNVTTTRSGLARLTFSSNPNLLAFRIEQEIISTVPITIEVNGNVPFSYEQRTAQASVDNKPIEKVTVRGPQSRVERVAFARATVNVNQLTANYNSPRPLQPIDASGGVISGVTVLPENVDVLVPIVSSVGIKRVPVVPQIVGQPAQGHVVTNVSVNPEFVTLTGSSGPLDNVRNASTNPVDIAGLSGVISRTVNIRMPSGVALVENEPQQVIVNIRTAPINQPFSISLPAQVLPVNVPPGLTVNISPNIVQVGLSGSAGQISALGANALQGTIDLRNVAPGTYTLAPAFNLPQGITITQQPRVTVTLRVQPSPVPTNTPVISPTAALAPEATAAPTNAPQPTNTPTTPASTAPGGQGGAPAEQATAAP